jgi:uncharacterized protein YjbI with pentapeptide repeats
MTGFGVCVSYSSLLAIACIAIAAATASAQAVFVDGKQNGNGVLRPRGTDCVVLTPAHVSGTEPLPVTIIGNEATRGQAELVRQFPQDIAILRVTDKGLLECPAWPSANIEATLQNATAGHLEIREADGSRTLMAVQFRVVDSETVTIRPTATGDQLQRTMSGASLLVNGVRVGMLLKIDEGREGVVYQYDDVMRLAQAYFGPAGAAAPEGTMDVAAAQAQLDRALRTRDGSTQGQSEAVAVLLASGHKFPNVNWSGISLRGAKLAGGSFRTAVMHVIDLAKVDARAADLSGTGARFSTLEGGMFSEANFTRSYLPFVAARDAKFDKADLTEATFFGSDLRGARFEGAKLRGASLAFTDLRGAHFDGADLTGAYLDGALTDATTTFKGATFENTSVLGAALVAPTLSAAQVAGACRHRLFFRSGQGFVEWTIILSERWTSSRFESGFEFEQVFDIREGFNNFTDHWMPECKTKPDVAVGFNVIQPATAQLYVDRSLLRVGNRAAEIERRVRQRLDDSLKFLGEDNNLPAPPELRTKWEASLKAAAAKPTPVGEPFGDPDTGLLFGLANNLFTPDQVDWEAQARNRYRWERGPREVRRDQPPLQSMWSMFFPDAPWATVKGQGVPLYRRWTLDRVKQLPRAIRVQRRLNFGSANKVDVRYRMSRFDSGSRGSEEVERLAKVHQYDKERFLTPQFLFQSTVLLLGRKTREGHATVVLMPQTQEAYQFMVPGALVGSDADLEVELTVGRVVADGDLVVLHATPGLVRAVKDGKEVWRGVVAPVTTGKH